jgi:serine/threonine-protein kinase
MHELREGEDFAGHRIEGVGGRGGMGIVYRALHVALNRTVALKVISPELAADADFRARFQREAQLAASIDHPNVIPVYDAAEVDGMLFITMRWVQGVDLGGLIQREGRLDAQTGVRIVCEVAAALDAAHARGLVHRDIKPGNVLIADADRHVYLTDFGLTREAGAGGGLTRTGMFVGTTDYASPEQIKGERLDARTDVYALGCVLVEAVTGSVPYDRDSEMSKMWAHVNDPPPRVRERVGDLPEELDEVVARALAKDPEERFPSAGDLARAASAAVEDRAIAEPERTVATGAAAPAGAAGGETIVSAAPAATAAGDTPPTGFPAVTPPPPGPWTPPPAPGAPLPAVGAPGKRRRVPRALLVAGAAIAAIVLLVGLLAIVGLIAGDSSTKSTAGKVLQPPIRVGRDPQDIAFTPGAAWVANLKDGTVTKIDTRTLKTRSIKVQGAPSTVVAGAGSVWAWVYDDSVVPIDVKTVKVSPYVDTGEVVDAIAFGNGALWAAHAKAGNVTRVDPKTKQITATIPVKGGPSSIDTGEGYVWVGTDKGLVEIDPATNSVLITIDLKNSLGGIEVRNGTVYVATGNDAITRVDAQSGAVAQPIPVSKSAAYYAIGGGSMWVDYPVDNVVKRIDLSTRKPIGDPIKLPFNPQGLVWGQDRLWVLDGSGDRVVRIQP